MEKATLEKYLERYDRIKERGSIRATNIFLTPAELGGIMARKDCFFLANDGALIILEPRHNFFHEIYFSASSLDSLKSLLKEIDKANFPILKAAVTGKEAMLADTLTCFDEAGFITNNKLIRFINEKPTSKMIDALRRLVGDNACKVSFARPDDAPEIYRMLKDEFDEIADNLQEIDEIKEDCAKNHITIIRDKGRIVSLHYFNLKNNISFNLHDLTLLEYRGASALFSAIILFEYDYFEKNNINLKRCYAWRDASKARLIKSSTKNNFLPDGVVTYNLVRK